MFFVKEGDAIPVGKKVKPQAKLNTARIVQEDGGKKQGDRRSDRQQEENKCTTLRNDAQGEIEVAEEIE